MAKQYGKNSADFAPEKLMSFGKSFSTINGQPIVKSEVWYDYDALVAFAMTDAAYVGQEVAYVDVDNNKITRYVVQLDGTLVESGGLAAGDEKTIRVAENGTISLLGVDTLTLERTEADGKVIKINYQPLLVDGKLTWVEPSATTVEGLATEIEGIKIRLSTLDDVAMAEKRIEELIGEVPEGKTIVGMISEVKSPVDLTPVDGTILITDTENGGKSIQVAIAPTNDNILTIVDGGLFVPSVPIKIADNAHGLVMVDGALALNLATKDSDGAMSKEDKIALDELKDSVSRLNDTCAWSEI